MDLFDILNKKPSVGIGESAFVAVGEVDEFGIPDGTLEDTSGDDFGSEFEDTNFNEGDFGYDDSMGEEQGEEEKPINPLEDIEDSEISLVTELRRSYTSLYNDSKSKFERLTSKNFETSEYGAEFKEIHEQYKEILHNMYLYMKNKWERETLPTKILQLNRFKMQINNLHETVNDLLGRIGIKELPIESL